MSSLVNRQTHANDTLNFLIPKGKISASQSDIKSNIIHLRYICIVVHMYVRTLKFAFRNQEIECITSMSLSGNVHTYINTYTHTYYIAIQC